MFSVSSNFQTAYAQYVKLIALFIFAIVHVMYMIPFLHTFAALASSIDTTDVTSNIESLHFRYFVETLADVSNLIYLESVQNLIRLKSLRKICKE